MGGWVVAPSPHSHLLNVCSKFWVWLEGSDIFHTYTVYIVYTHVIYYDLDEIVEYFQSFYSYRVAGTASDFIINTSLRVKFDMVRNRREC